MSLLKQSAGSLPKHILFREKTESFQPPSEAELETHHGPFLKVMHDILALVDQKDLNTNTLEMYQGMKRILHMAKGTGVLPDGSTETFQERCAKGVSNTAYAKAEYWVENKYVRLYSILKPKSSDVREVEDGRTNWKAKWIFTNQDKKNDDPKITHRQGMLCTFFILDGDSFTLDHVKKFRHEYDTRETMNDLYQYYRKFFIKEALWDDVGCLFNAYSKHKLQAFEDSIEIDQFLARKKERLKEENEQQSTSPNSAALSATPSQGGLKLSLSSLKGAIKSTSSAISPRGDAAKSPRGVNTNNKDKRVEGDADAPAMLGSPYSSNQRLKSDVITSNPNVLTSSGSNLHVRQTSSSNAPKPLTHSSPGSTRQQRDESLLLNPLPAHYGTSPRQQTDLNSNQQHPNPGTNAQPFVVNSNLTINLNMDSNNNSSSQVTRANSPPVSPRAHRGDSSAPLNIRAVNSPHSPPVSPRYNVSPLRQPTQGLNSNGFGGLNLNSNSNQSRAGAHSPPSSPRNNTNTQPALRDSSPAVKANVTSKLTLNVDHSNHNDTSNKAPLSPRSRAPPSRAFTQGVSPMLEDLVIPTVEGNIVLKNITAEDELSPRKKDMVLSASRGKK